jgi:hypothetical protein
MQLAVPAMPCLIVSPDRPVFDAYNWCTSDVIEWRLPVHEHHQRNLKRGRAIQSANPPELVFVLRNPSAHAFLPRELARLHAFDYGLGDEECLAPWAIDDATDRLYEHNTRPHDVFWLAAPAIDTLVWGLHDWAHFHNHGPFDQQALTELQCDLLALAWLRLNAAAIGLSESDLTGVARDLAALSRSRFEEERASPPVTDLDALFAGPYPSAPLL